jgi:hypothetical protein
MPPLMFDILKSQFITHFPGADMWPEIFAYSEGTRSIRFRTDGNPRDPRYIDDLGLGEVVAIYDSDGQYRGIGMPRLQAIRNDVELRLKGISHNMSLMDNGARIGGIVSFKSDMTPEQREAVAQDFRSLQAGAANAGRVMVTAGGEMDFQALMQNARDMDFVKLIEMVEDAMASRYNVPVTLFRTQAQTNNNYETAWNILYDQAVLPTFDLVYASLAQIFSMRLNQPIEIVHDSLTNPVLARQAQARASALFRDKILSRNEARQIVGYEPVLGGDKIYGPMGEIPVAEDLFTGIDEANAVEEFEARRAEAISVQRRRAASDDDPKKPEKKPDRAASEKAFATLLAFADNVRGLTKSVVH